MELSRLFTLIVLTLAPLVCAAISFNLPALFDTSNEHACDNSHVIIRNQTDITFTINDYLALADSSLTLKKGYQSIPPNAETHFQVYSGASSLGESLGIIKLQGKEREYELFYLFGHFFVIGNCSVKYDVTTNRFSTRTEKYNIDCHEDPTNAPMSLVCSIKNPKD